jgi:tetratricopeptide (TPR) repeat protein
MGMSVGFHMGSILVCPGVFVLVLFAERKALSTFDMTIVLAVIAAFVMSTMKIPDFFVLTIFGTALAAAAWRTLTWGEKDEIAQNRWFAFAAIGLFLLGLSVHLFMMIRAHHDPLINQTDPTTFDALLSVLRREQYPPRSIFEREAPLLWQIGHLLGTVTWQGGQLAGRQVIGFVEQFTFLPSSRPTAADIFVPTALILLGVVYQVRNHWRLGASFLVTLLVNSVGLLILLNFTAAEVRDRDYFYFGFYQFAALFLGLGAGGLLRDTWRALRERASMVVRLAAGLLLVLPLLPVLLAGMPHPKWFEHDRSENWIAYHYGKNILAGLPPNAILATNGDNDTFPLWYLQEVEGFRTDVRVVNLSLINLPWYIKQLRDYEPKLPITWNDAQIEAREDITFRQWRTRLEPQRLPDDSVAWVRDITMWHVVNQNNWQRPIYYAITVPDENIGMFLPFLRMEGMVYRLTAERSESENPTVDVEKIWTNFQEVYDFTSVLDANGYMRGDIHRDAQTQHLLRNYPASLTRVGWLDAREGNYERATEALERAYRMEPSFPLLTDLLPLIYLQQGRTAESLAAARRVLPYLRSSDEGALQYGEALLRMQEDETLLEWARDLVDRHPMSMEFTQLLVRALVVSGDLEGARREVDAWAERSGDTSARREFEFFLEQQREQDSQPDSVGLPEEIEP